MSLPQSHIHTLEGALPKTRLSTTWATAKLTQINWPLYVHTDNILPITRSYFPNVFRGCPQTVSPEALRSFCPFLSVLVKLPKQTWRWRCPPPRSRYVDTSSPLRNASGASPTFGSASRPHFHTPYLFFLEEFRKSTPQCVSVPTLTGFDDKVCVCGRSTEQVSSQSKAWGILFWCDLFSMWHSGLTNYKVL